MQFEIEVSVIAREAIVERVKFQDKSDVTGPLPPLLTWMDLSEGLQQQRVECVELTLLV